MGEQENKDHATQKEFDSYVDLVDTSKMLMSEKTACRKLLATAFGNTNGDPPEVKQRKMCQFDFELAKHIVEMRVLLSELIRTMGERGKDAAPNGKWERFFLALEGWKNQIAAVLIAWAFAPHGVEIINAIKGAVQ